MKKSDWSTIADDLDRAIGVLCAAGVAVEPTSRLVDAVSLLRGYAAGGKVPSNPVGRTVTVNALASANDFTDIANSLTPPLSPDAVGKLRVAVNRGSLQQNEVNRQPYQYQSEFWVGAVLVTGELRPQVPPVTSASSPPPNPDFLLKTGTLAYGVEVKRPSTWATVETDHLPKACEQMRSAGVTGAVVIDATDPLAGESFVDVDDKIKEYAGECGDVLFDSVRHIYQNGFHPLIACVVYKPRHVGSRRRRDETAD